MNYVIVMAKKIDYNITKLEKGPLQRFKNQNLILKKYREVGLKIYRAVTGKRTVAELQKDLDIKKDLFNEIVDYMKEAGMVELTPVGEKKVEAPPKEFEAEVVEELPPEKEEIELPPPEEEIKPGEVEPKEIVLEEEEVPKEEEEAPEEDEIKPIGIEPIEEEAPEEEPEEITPEEEEITPEDEEEPEREEVREEREEPEEEEAQEEEFEFEADEAQEEGEGLTPIEKIIKDKYGDIGLQVYNLIDGQKTAEEIMNETGLSESKLIEILDFMDEQGIIKLDYPKAKEKPAVPTEEEKKEARVGFGPMIEAEGKPKIVTIPSPVEIPVRSPLDIVKSVQLKAKMMLKHKEGGKIFEQINGKRDVIDIALKLGIPLYKIYDILLFMMENNMIIMKPITREQVKKKYGDDGYTVYKKYGREGLMLYELIGKDLTIKQMADKVTKDYPKVINMFLFIHEVLGIELPIDKEVLARQLGIS